MYKSIVFDLGGVMIDFDPRGYLVDRLCNAETEEEVYDLTFGSEEWKLLDAGLISRFDGNHRMLEKARAANAAPVRRGDPGYGAHLDRDNDGIGCEPYRGR